MTNDVEGDDGPERRLEIAIKLHRKATDMLTQQLDAIVDGEGSTKNVVSVAGDHMKAILKLLEMEKDVESFSGDGSGGGLDLAAAREDIEARLSRLAADRGSDGVAG